MKLLCIDTETSGVNPDRHALIQLAGSIIVDGVEVERFNIQMAPYPDDEIEPKALEVNGLDEATIRAYQSPQNGYREFQAILARHCDKYKRSDKYHLLGFNADFDASFVRKLFEKNDDVYFGSWVFWPVLDVAKLAGLRLMTKRHQMMDFKLMTVAKFLMINVDPSKAHDAMYDIDVTIEIFKQLTKDLAFLEVAMEKENGITKAV